MGGSSLGPEVLARTFGRPPGFPELLVLDSTVPAQVAGRERIDLAKTLFIVSSKSGGTLEPNLFKQYFFDASAAVGRRGGRHAASSPSPIPDSKLHRRAKTDGFRDIFFGWPDIGGRFSALSNFGLVPAAVMGMDVATFLDGRR